MRLGIVLAAMVFFIAPAPRALLAASGDDQYAVAARHYAAQRWELAAEGFKTLRTQFSEHDRSQDARFYAGEALVQLGRYSDAAVEFTQFLRQVPEHDLADQALFRQGETRYLAGDFEPAITAFTDFLQRHADHDLCLLARLYLAGANLTLAERDVASNTDRLQEAERLYAQVVQQATGEPFAAQSQFGLARSQHLLNKLEQAAHGYSKLLQDANASVTAQSHFYLAEIRAVEHRHADAASAYETLIQQAPQSRWAKSARGRVVLQRALAGEFDAARRALDDWQVAAGSQKLDRQTLIATAQLARDAGQSEWTASLYQLLADTAEDVDHRMDDLRELAMTQLDAGEPDKAIQTLLTMKSDAKKPQRNAEATYLLGIAYQIADRQQDALESFRSVVESWPECDFVAPSLFREALLLESLGKNAQAAAIYAQVVKRPASAQWQATDAATVLYRWGWLLKDLDRDKEAAARFAQLHEEHQDSKYWADATYRVADDAMDRGNHDTTRSILAKLLAAEISDDLRKHALYLDARAAQAASGWSAMRAPLQRLIEEFPGSDLGLTAECWLAESAYQSDQFSQAQQRFNNLADRLDDLSANWQVTVPLRQAQLYARDQHWQQARSLAEGILKRSDSTHQHDELHYLLGRCHMADGALDDARRSFRQSIDAHPDAKTETAAMAQWMIGESLMHQQRYDQAVPEYFRVEAIYGYPKWQSAALLQAAKCYERLGHHDEAKKLYRQIQKDYSQTTYVKEATERLHSTPTDVVSSSN